jgi:site-specific DNA-methyltransferase (adenine-specific)
MVPNSAAFVFTDWRRVPTLGPAIESVGLRFRNQLVWDKGNAGLGVGFKPAYEVVMEFAKGTTLYAAKNGQNVLRYTRVPSGKKEHGAAKPVELLSEILRMAPPQGDGDVLDPFLGSGSTLVAAKSRGLRCVGVEVEERYCEIAAKRLAQEVMDFGGAT